MLFGLTNTLATFSAYINRALAGLVNIYYIVYLDDILVFSASRKLYILHLREVLMRLRKFVLYTNRKKYKFFTEEVEFLGYIVSVVGVSIDKRRVTVIEE